MTEPTDGLAGQMWNRMMLAGLRANPHMTIPGVALEAMKAEFAAILAAPPAPVVVPEDVLAAADRVRSGSGPSVASDIADSILLARWVRDLAGK